MPRRLSCSSQSSYTSSYSSPYSSASSPSSSPVSLPMLTPPSTSHGPPVKDPKPYACPIPSCTKRCKTQHTLSVHLRAHSKPKTRPEFPCSVPGCHLHFSRRHDRLRHEVAKHNKKNDCWVIVDGQVLDVTNFLPDHPGGEKAILLYAGRDATEEFNMLHDPKVIPRYAADSVIGSLKA